MYIKKGIFIFYYVTICMSTCNQLFIFINLITNKIKKCYVKLIMLNLKLNL